MEGAVRKAFGVKEEDKEKGGLASLFGGGKDKDDEDDGNKGGLFSFGDDKKKDDDTGGFFSKILDRDDDKGGEKRTGFHGLFSEQEGASGGGENEEMPRFDEGSCPGPGLSDGGTRLKRDPCRKLALCWHLSLTACCLFNTSHCANYSFNRQRNCSC